MSDKREPVLAPDRRRLAENFDRAAPGYDEAAALQRTVADSLLERLDMMRIAPQRILDLGSGTGAAARQLEQRYPRSRVIQMDIAPNMLLQSRQRSRRWFSRQSCVCGDAAQLPFMAESADLVFSSLMLQWCDDLEAVLAQIRNCLKGGGLFLFSTLGPDTLHELRESWLEADGEAHTHVNGFRDMHEVGDALLRAGLADPVMEVDHLVLTYDGVREVMTDLKQLGARNIDAGRRRTLTGKKRLQAMMNRYERFRRDGRIPATYEVVYGHAWMPEAPRFSRPDNGVVTIPVDSVSRRRG